MRLENWPQKLAEVIEGARKRPFLWGEHDCSLFVADCVDAMTGSKHANQYRGKYKTAKGAAGILKKHGGIEGLVDSKFDPMPRSFARRGDIALLEMKGSPLGIVDVNRVACVGENGLHFLPMNKTIKVWRV